jgi:hypothetical protein
VEKKCYIRNVLKIRQKTEFSNYRTVYFAIFEVSTALKIQVEVFWLVTPCKYCAASIFILKIEAACSFETFVSHHNTIRRHNSDGRGSMDF